MIPEAAAICGAAIDAGGPCLDVVDNVERQTMWHEAGSRDLKYSPDIALPATVLQLGWGEE